MGYATTHSFINIYKCKNVHVLPVKLQQTNTFMVSMCFVWDMTVVLCSNRWISPKPQQHACISFLNASKPLHKLVCMCPEFFFLSNYFIGMKTSLTLMYNNYREYYVVLVKTYMCDLELPSMFTF